MRPESTCSILSLKKGRGVLRSWTYHKENREHYQIVNGCRTATYLPDIPHDFLPCQAYLIFHGRVNKCGERGIDDVAYLIRQGQKEVVEEDGCGRNSVILVEIACSQEQKR